jgi:hypothetical protein
MEHLKLFEDFSKTDNKINDIINLIDKKTSPIFVYNKIGTGLITKLDKKLSDLGKKYSVIRLSMLMGGELERVYKKYDINVFEEFDKADIEVRNDALEIINKKNKIFILIGGENSLDGIDSAIKSKFTIVK